MSRMITLSADCNLSMPAKGVLDGLVKAEYVIQLENGAYAVNKLKIPQMKVKTL